MLPSSSRVKLNRVALKDVVGPEPAPRRRRVPPGNVRASSGKRGSDPELSGAVSEKDTSTTTSSSSSSSSIPGSSEPVRGVRDRVGPDSETGTEDSRVDINRNTYPSPTGLAGSEGSLRRAVTASRCGLCGDSKFKSPQQKTLGKQGQKSSSQRPERSMIELKIKRGNPVTETSKKPIVGIDRYLKVTLCDIAQKYDVCGHDFGCVLPDALKTKVVRCFKQDMRAGFRLGPSLKQDKHKSEESALTKNSKLCPRVQSGKRVCQSQSLNEHKRHLKEHTDAENLSSHTTYHFPEGWPSEASTTCSVSLLLGKRTNSGCKTSMWDRNVEEEPGSRAEFYRDKRIKLGDSVKDGRLRSTPDLESINCNEQAKAFCISKEKTFSGTSEYSWPCLEYKCGGCSTCRSTVKENCVHKIPFGQIGEPRKNDAAQISSKLFCQRNQADTDELESFTCQRVRVYCRKINSTCARTYLSWPFSNISHTLTAHAGTTALPEEAVRPSARNKSDSPKNQNQSSPPSSQTTDMLPSAPTDPPSDATQLFFCQNEEKQEEKGEHTIAKRNGTRHGTMSSYSSDSKTTEFVAHIMEAEKTLASLVPNTASLSILSQHGKEPGTNTVSVPSTPVNGPETDSSMSTPSPSALGLSDWETATTLSPMSSLFKHGSLSSLSATPSPLPPSTFPPEQVKGVKLAEAHSTSTSSTAFSPKHIIKAVEKPLFYCEETQMTLCCSSARASSFSSHNSDSFHSCESSPLLLPQDAEGSDIETFTDMSQSQLEPYYNASACNKNPPLALEQSVETTSNDFMLPPLLSPVNSPQGHLCISFLPQKQCCSNEEEQEQEEINKDTRKHKMLPGHHMPQIGDGNHQNYEENPDHHQHEGHSNEELEGVSSKYKTLSSHSSVGDLNDGIKEESQDKTDYTEYVEQGIGGSEQVPLVLKIKANLPSGVLTEPCSPPSSDGEQPRSTRDEDSCPSENAGRERDKTEAVGDTRPGILDECAAYEQDILLVNVIQDDPELFENLPEESVLKLGPTGVSEAPKTRLTGVVKKLSPMIDGASLEFEQRSTPVIVNFHCDSPDTTEESNNRPWRPQSSSSTSKTQNSTWPATDEKTRNMGQSDKNDNDDVNGDLERSQPIQTLNSPHNIPPLMTVRNGQWITNPVNMTDFRRQKSNAYCRQYFSESLSCGFKMCRFQHVPVEGDEKFCVETVTRFIKNPMCLQKAGAVFTGYYQNNPPGVYFSMSVLLSLLQALLKAGMVSDVFSVLSVSLAHKILPGHEFLLALFNFVRENGLMGSVPELMQLTFRMASAGLVLSLDCLDCVKNTPEFHQTVHPNSPVSLSGHIKQVNLHVYHKRLSTSAPPPEYLKFAHSVVEIELCTKQEDWRRMGEVFRSICQSSQHPNQVEQISGRIAIALLSESKDKLSLPFSAFADTGEASLIRSFLGRIGVSLMLRYHKTHQWTKGRRVVEVLSTSKVSYSTLKGLFGNEDGASRCYLVTVATELFLLSGSVEGALNTLRENKWFLSSCLWPCELADLDSRSRVLMRLAEKTSHRDTLEVLCNLPGMKEPNDLIDISRYGPLFNSHLQVCVDRQILSIASDTVDFMLSKNLAVDHAMLQILLLKLGKQNLWLRAREVFRDSLNVGYYPGLLAPPGFMALIVPCRLGEVELALTFEMFISVNAAVILQLSETATSCLSITLKRTQSGESEYLSAGSRLLSAACIPQPKLIVHYKAVNSSQEQVFTLDISSARRWLRHNHLWANEVWTH